MSENIKQKTVLSCWIIFAILIFGLGRTEEARELVLDFQKKTIVTMIIGYLGELLFLISFLVMVVSKQTSLPQWACNLESGRIRA